MTALAFKPTPINYLGKKGPYMHLVADLGIAEATRFLDFTAGSSTVPLYMVECHGARELICNDVSPYCQMIAEALFVREPMSISRIRRHAVPVPREGYLYAHKGEFSGFKRMSPAAAAWVDGYCCLNAGEPLMLLALACVLGKGAERFSDLVGVYLEALRPKDLEAKVRKVALSLAMRQHGLRVSATITAEDYLAVDFERGPFGDLSDWVVYLDPAWPTQPGHRTLGNERTYGLYASIMMSVLRQEAMPMPSEYSVTLEDFYVGMRKTIAGVLERGGQMLVAYQTTEERVREVEREVLAGHRFSMVSVDKNKSSTLREYLFLIESA